MAFGARILKDSIAPCGVRLVTFEVTHPRYILAEVNTHKMISKNSASSRAIPVATMLQRLKDDPYTPIYWGANKKGMQAGEELDEATQKLCLEEWLAARDDAMQHAERLRELGLHKQDANRLLEPFMWHTAILSATEWDNFFHLRNHPDAHPAFQTVAVMMQELYEENEPEPVAEGDWHMPLIEAEDIANVEDVSSLADVSVGRCARVSTLTHDGRRDLDEDRGLKQRLLTSGHMSPFEHVARPIDDRDYDNENIPLMVSVHSEGIRKLNAHLHRETWCGNFRGWVQMRKTIPNEHDMLRPR